MSRLIEKYFCAKGAAGSEKEGGRKSAGCHSSRRLSKEGDYLGNGPAMMGPESTGSQACLQ